MDTVIVFDDMRKMEPEAQQLMEGIGMQVLHCETVLEFQEVLRNTDIISCVYLDHDLGGVAFGEETARDGVKFMCDKVLSGDLVIDHAIIVTMNPAGQSWIRSELQRAGIHHQEDPGGRNTGLVSPKGW